MTITRRSFIKYMGLGTAGVLTSCASNDVVGSHKENNGEMVMRENPSTRDKVSLLGYGCMRFPRLNTPEENGNILDQKKINELIDYAIQNGVNYFDTAPVYCEGWSEEAVGNALSRHPRSSYFVATKLSRMPNPTLENSIQMYHNSMKKLQVDYIDYYLLHSVGGGEDPFALFNKRFIDNGLLDYLLEERKAGRIRNLGFSFHGDVRLFDYLLTQHDKVHWDFVQIQLNYSDWRNPGVRNVKAEYLYGELEKRGIPAIVMEPLLGGRLSDLPDHIMTRIQARDPEHSVASWAFRFAGSFPDVLTVLSGMRVMEHLQENIETYSNFRPVTEDDMKFLDDMASMISEYTLIPCNDCKYCMPCNYGLDIPAILTYYNKCIIEGNFPRNSSDPNYQAQRRKYLIGYDNKIEKVRQADHCTGCGECIQECPQKIDIPKMLRKVDNYVTALKQGTVSLMTLKETLNNGKHSLVICPGGTVVRTFDGKGVSDLYKIYSDDRILLKGASLADKVVGKGAALFMVLGGVKEVYASLISLSALQLFKEHDIRVIYDKRTEQIMNNSNSDICPVEKICMNKENIEECVPLIGEFLKSIGLI